MAPDTLSPDHDGVTVGEHHRARGRVFSRRTAAALSRGRAVRLHRDVAVTPAGASRSSASTAQCSRHFPGSCPPAWSTAANTGGKLPAGAAERPVFRVRDPPPGQHVTVHRPPEQPDSFLLRRGRRAHKHVRSGAGHRVKLVSPAELARMIAEASSFAAAYRRTVARGAAWISGAAAESDDATGRREGTAADAEASIAS